MKAWVKKAAALTQGDLRNIFREPIMLVMLSAPVLLVAMMKFIVPLAGDLIEKETGFILSDYNQYIETFFMIISAMMLGLISGFIILDERDDDILLYFSVTPVTKTGYLFYRVVSSILAVAFVVECIAFISGMRGIHLVKTIPLAFLAASEGPMIALFLVIYAKNKVEGLAMAKLSGFIMLAPFAILIPSKLNFIAGIFPPFWITKIYIEISSGGSNYFLFIAAGLIIHSLWLYFFIKRFINRTI